MAIKETTASTAAKADVQSFLNWGQGRTDAALALQKELLAAYEGASRAWLARVQSEVALWSDLASKLTATRTVPEALETYSQCVSQRMKMAADDGRLLADEAQQITQKITKSLGNGWPTAST
jgi:Phasin protein